ncbi:Eco57I restriction-modification methylase domain-containing protein [Pseudomonas atacamensis]|uniref:Eco57I restriction-modification methylase domain-containing protein n=1 Tax=Pseudomonas atacamensis TaxID=2565368 RepID=UPI003857E8DA
MTSLLHAESPTNASEAKPISLARKRELGAFYTPSSVTKVLCDWAIRSPNDIVLEPSFGGCNFLEASFRRIQELGAAAANNIYGCDIDPAAFKMLDEKDIELNVDHFQLKNFLALRPYEIHHAQVDAVIGNPPYVRYSKLDEDQRSAIHTWENEYNCRLNRRASLWVYFSYHALHFLREGGRMAWVLPVSFITAQYASGLRELFFKSFKKLAFFTLTERIFLLEGTEERALIVLADGYGANTAEAHITSSYVENLNELCSEIERWSRECDLNNPGSGKSNFGVVTKAVEDAVSVLKKQRLVTELGEVADIGIGVVTGDSKFFVRSRLDWKKDGIGLKHLSYIVPRSRNVPGVEVTREDKNFHIETDVSCLALNAPVNSKSLAVLKYLSTYESASIKTNATFSKRDCWFRFLDDKVPDAFFVFMTHHGPRLIMNSVEANTTNGLYRVNFKSDLELCPKLIAVTIQTTFTQLEAEKLGRPRGSGALKLEPYDAKRMMLYIPQKTGEEIDSIFSVVDGYMRQGRESCARKAADSFIFSDAPVFMEKLPLLEESLLMARRRRIRNKEVSDERA